MSEATLNLGRERGLSGRSLMKFSELHPALVALGTLRSLNLDTLALYCEAYASWREASEKVLSTTSVARDGRGGIIVNPWVTVRDTAATRMEQYGRALGLAPDRPLRLEETLVDYMGIIEDDDYGQEENHQAGSQEGLGPA